MLERRRQGQNQTETDPDLPPFLSQLEEAEDWLRQSGQALQKNDADSGIEFQEQSADALARAFEIVVAQNERLSLLQDLLLFQRSVGFANGYARQKRGRVQVSFRTTVQNVFTVWH